MASGARVTEAEREMWRWAMQGIRDHELGVLVAWGGIKATVLAELLGEGCGERLEAAKERVHRAGRSAGLHGAIICRTEAELGPKAIEMVKRIEPQEDREEGCYWLEVGGRGAKIGVPRSLVEEIRKGARKTIRSHTQVRRQHHIPVWLSQGFAEPTQRNGKLKVYERDGTPSGMTRTPESWGVSNWFYNNEEGSVDPMLDEWDQMDSRIVAKLREGGREVQAAIQEVPAMLTRLVLRRASTRSMFEEKAREVEAGWHAMAAAERRAGSAKERYVRRLRNGAQGVREIIEEDLRAQGVDEEELDRKIDEWMAEAARRAEKMDEAIFEEAAAGAPMRARLESNVDAKGHHIEWLRDELGRGGFEKYRKDMRYTISVCSEPILILGDAVVVESRVGYAKPHDPLEEPDRPLEAVYLPIGKDKMLTGCRNGYEPRDLGWIVAAQSRLARRSFIGANIENRYAEGEQGRIGECLEGINVARGYAEVLETRETRDGPRCARSRDAGQSAGSVVPSTAHKERENEGRQQ